MALFGGASSIGTGSMGFCRALARCQGEISQPFTRGVFGKIGNPCGKTSPSVSEKNMSLTKIVSSAVC